MSNPSFSRNSRLIECLYSVEGWYGADKYMESEELTIAYSRLQKDCIKKVQKCLHGIVELCNMSPNHRVPYHHGEAITLKFNK